MVLGFYETKVKRVSECSPVNPEITWNVADIIRVVNNKNAIKPSFWRLPSLLLVLVLFATLWVLEEKPKGGEAKEEGLEEPQAACAHVGDAFVTAGTQKKYKKS